MDNSSQNSGGSQATPTPTPKTGPVDLNSLPTLTPEELEPGDLELYPTGKSSGRVRGRWTKHRVSGAERVASEVDARAKDDPLLIKTPARDPITGGAAAEHLPTLQVGIATTADGRQLPIEIVNPDISLSEQIARRRARTRGDIIAAAEEELGEFAVDEDVTMVPVKSLGSGGELLQFSPDLKPWERQPEETNAAWRVFQVYRDLPSYHRSIKAALRVVYGEKGGNNNYHLIRTQSRLNRWEERVAEYDRYFDSLMLRELETRRLQTRIETADLGELMRSKAADALEVLDATIYRTVKQADGTTKKVLRTTLSVNEITRLAEVGVKLERLALGEDDEQGGGGVRVTVHMERVDPRSLDERAREILEEREAVAAATKRIIDAEFEEAE